jgi:hypothetical protein
VEKADGDPQIFVGSSFAGVGAHAGFDGERVFEKTFGLSELVSTQRLGD